MDTRKGTQNSPRSSAWRSDITGVGDFDPQIMSRKGGGGGGGTPLYYIKKVVKKQTLNALLASAERGKGPNDKMAHN